jgi:hypothetical protein
MPSQDRIDALLGSAVTAANARFAEELIPEAAILLRAVERVDPAYPGVADLREKLDARGEPWMERGWLGINRRLRVRGESGFLTRLLLWAPDRLLDLLDLVTVDVHLGLGALVDVHATRAVQVAAGLRAKGGIGLHDQRSLGLANDSGAGFAVLAMGTQTFSGSSTGVPAGVITGSESIAGMHRPSSPLYRDYRDYWALGASTTAGIAGAEIDLHPVQLFDLIGGIFFLDFAHDDLATTRRLKLDRMEHELLTSLSEIERARVWEPQPAEGGAGGT